MNNNLYEDMNKLELHEKCSVKRNRIISIYLYGVMLLLGTLIYLEYKWI